MIKFFIVSVFLLGLLYHSGSLNKEGYLKAGCFLLFLLMGLRNELCFMDTPRYVYQFLEVSKMTIRDVFNYNSKDPLFWVVASLIGKVTGGNYTIWMLVCSAPFSIGFYRLLKQYSNNILISLAVFLGLGFFTFLFTGMRQTVALGFIILALSYILDNKVKQFLVYTFIAVLFHKTAIVFLIMWPLSFVRISKKTMFVYFLLLVALMSISSSILRDFIFINVMDFDDRFATYEEEVATLSNMGLYKQIFFFIVSLVIMWRKERTSMEDLLINASAVGILFQSMSASIAEMFRISMYFSISNTILLAIAINHIDNISNRSLMKIGIPLLVFAYILAANSTGWNLDYHFFFENITFIKTV